MKRLWQTILLLLLLPGAAMAAPQWWDNHYTFRRGVDVTWDSAHPEDNPLCEVRFYTAGHIEADGSDIRVTTDAGVPVVCQTLMVGPDDTARVIFQLAANVRKYYVYFGNAKAVAPGKDAPRIKFDTGLLLETRQWNGHEPENAEALKKNFEDCAPVIGRTIVDRAFVGPSPFGEQPQTVSHLSGMLSCPSDGEYVFAASAESHGALFIDGKPIIYAPWAPADIRFHHTMTLKRGRVPFDFYILHNGGEQKLSVGWKTPELPKVEVIPRNAFGIANRGNMQAMEEFTKRFTSDFTVENAAESFVASTYSHRYRFAAKAPAEGNASYLWDFGDGLSSTDQEVEHVFLPGMYPVKLTTRVGNFADVQTNRVWITRDFDRLLEPPTDPPAVHAKIIADYKVDAVPLRWLPWMALMEKEGNQRSAMLATCKRIASEPTHPDTGFAHRALRECTMDALKNQRMDAIIAVLDSAPPQSDLQPRISRFEGDVLIWWAADFAKAVKVLEPLGSKAGADPGAARTFAEACILDQKVEQGRRILTALPLTDDARKQPVISGALARTIEFYIDEKDWETGEEQWDRWENKYPAVFLEGYSVMLRTRLMELRHYDAAAARVAEAFARAIPNSPYSPPLLDRASKLLAKTDPEKSKALRADLKKRYPEDPLSQD